MFLIYFYYIFPVIIDAVDLMTKTYSINLEYRQQLAKGDSSEDSFLETTEGIIAITVPICAGMLVIIDCEYN